MRNAELSAELGAWLNVFLYRGVDKFAPRALHLSLRQDRGESQVDTKLLNFAPALPISTVIKILSINSQENPY